VEHQHIEGYFALLLSPRPYSLSIIREGNSQLYVCKIDFKKFDIPEEELLEGVKIVDLMDVSALMLVRETVRC
jgi:intracellular sulfur oxidation DsrE/DsrF family protein